MKGSFDKNKSALKDLFNDEGPTEIAVPSPSKKGRKNVKKDECLSSKSDPLKKRRYAKVGRPKSSETLVKKEHHSRTLWVDEELYQKVRHISSVKALTIGEIVDEGLRTVIKKFEKDNGKINL